MASNTLTLNSRQTEAVGSSEFAVHPNSHPAKPTVEAYGFWQVGYTFLNDRLFGSSLPNCMITFNRRRKARGYFCAGAFENRNNDIAHEISMNSRWLAVRGDAESLSTFAHEMVHLWRHVAGPLNRKGGKGTGGYHDRVWADRMIAIGLMPTDTGRPDGKHTGYGITHFIIEGGPFDLACRELLNAGLRVDWRGARPVDAAGSTDPTPQEPHNTRTRFVCESCDVRAWARRSAKLSCDDCSLPLRAR